jgi:hypothetical protein
MTKVWEILKKLASFGAGGRTYGLATLQGIASVAFALGYIDAAQYALLAQFFGWPMIATVAHKLVRESSAHA